VFPDIHGQFWDLTGGVLAKCGEPSPENGYLFNVRVEYSIFCVLVFTPPHRRTNPPTFHIFQGDFVDRGSWGVECFLTLLSWKLKYPKDVFMTRGSFIIISEERPLAKAKVKVNSAFNIKAGGERGWTVNLGEERVDS
jgi:hypothetical protein